MSIVTIGNLLDKGIISRSTKVKVTLEKLKELNFIKPLSKQKVLKLSAEGLVKKGLIKK